MATNRPADAPRRPRPPPLEIDRSSSPQESSTAGHPRVGLFKRDSGSRKPSNDFGEPNEQSPLLLPRQSTDNEIGGAKRAISPIPSEESEESWNPVDVQESKSSWYMLLLSLGGLGLQIGWSVEMSNGSPYLLSLGLSKALLALVWLAGPLSGVIVQPIVGLQSDRCRVKWGRRRPFVLSGAAGTIVAIMMLAWTREIVGGFLGLFGADVKSHGVALVIMLTAVVFIYVLDFAINVLQAAIRAYVVDCTPTHQQDSANAWISRQMGIGNIIGMTFGFMNLPAIFPFLGSSQFKVLCALASIITAVTVGISCASVPELDPRTSSVDSPSGEGESLKAFFRSLWNSVTKLPPQIARVCEVQFLAWIGWFPFLFYTTTYIGEIYVEPIFERAKEEGRVMTEDEINATWDLGTRRGTLALLLFSIVTFVASVLLPFFVAPSFKAPESVEQHPTTPMTPTTSGSILALGYFNTKAIPRRSTRFERFRSLIGSFADNLVVPGLTLRRAWFLSHLLFAGCMFTTFIVRSVTLATILVGIIGISWALTMWAPFALISAEISKRDAIRRGLIRPPPNHDSNLLAANEDDSADQAGVVLGIHNVSISAPQVLATLISSLIFKIAAKPRGIPGDESVAWCFRFGGVCALVAAYLTTRVREENEGLRPEGAGVWRDRDAVTRHTSGFYDGVRMEDDDEE